MATLQDLNVDALAALGDNPQGDIDTMFVLLSGFMVRPLSARNWALPAIMFYSSVCYGKSALQGPESATSDQSV
jgi:hypothetical protein